MFGKTVQSSIQNKPLGDGNSKSRAMVTVVLASLPGTEFLKPLELPQWEECLCLFTKGSRDPQGRLVTRKIKLMIRR